MIGGIDVILPARPGPTALEACAHAVQRYWPRARFEDAETAEKYKTPDDPPFDQIRELLVYSDPEAEAAWDADSPDSPVNSMIYLIHSDDSVTAVVDDPEAAEMASILGFLREALEMDILNATNADEKIRA